MNIPYDKFYSAEAESIENLADLDAVSSATVAKTKMNGKGQLFEGTYNNSGEEGSDTIGKIYGVNYPVAVNRSALKAFGNEYAFTPSEEKPEAYKLVLLKDGEISFEKVNDAEPENIEASPKTETDTKRGDYMLTVNEASGFGVIYGVIIKTDDGKYYAMRHERNIWRNELAWSVGFLTDDGKGNALEYENMLATNGATVTEIKYITDKGYITVSTDTYLPKKFCKYSEPPDHVENADINDGKTTFAEDEFPNDYRKEYSVSGLDAHIRSGEIEFENAAPGAYKLTVTDAAGVYESVSAEFTLFTNDIPAVFDSKAVRLVAAEGFTDEQLAAYLKNITSVTVDRKEYAASGKKAVKIIKEDGSLDTGSDVFAEGESFEITVKSAGYATDLSFTYRVNGEENKEQYTINFDTDGGSDVAPITQEAGTKVVPPKAPVKAGYTFIGWEPEMPEIMPSENITLKALWKRDLPDTPRPGVSQSYSTGVSSNAGGSSVTGAGSSGNAPAATPSDGKSNDPAPTGTAVNGDTPAPTPPSTDGGAASSDNPSTGSEDPFSAFMFIAAASLAAADLINKKVRKDEHCKAEQ